MYYAYLQIRFKKALDSEKYDEAEKILSSFPPADCRGEIPGCKNEVNIRALTLLEGYRALATEIASASKSKLEDLKNAKDADSQLLEQGRREDSQLLEQLGRF